MRDPKVNLCVLALVGLYVGMAHTQTVTTVFNFSSVTGEYPDLVYLAQGRDGALYGTT